MTDAILHLEERAAHLERMLEDLSEVVARQEAQIARLERRVDMLLHRAAERESQEDGSLPLADQRPPHW
ncbi:SlyX family protein [Brevirhabdus sp.]|uniref:SlyX family protein n=1 Tax=Brevirhabdus sp. TaxID=2004514 RepID=UPI00405942AE